MRYVVVDEDHGHMRTAKVIAQASRCIKQRVGCVLVSEGNIVGVGNNDVRYPPDQCPRIGTPTGEGYGICRALCHQRSHAERDAVADFQANGYQSCHPMDAYLWGHYYACQECLMALQQIGVERLFILDPDRWIDDLPTGADE